MKNYSLVVSSRTGNTARLAQALKAALAEAQCLYAGPPDEAALAAPVVLVGFWTDKGQADEETLHFLERLHGKRVYLFGTAGFGREQTYYEEIMERTKAHLASDNDMAGWFMCQGKMPPSVGERYSKALAEKPDDAQLQALAANFLEAQSHPDEQDLENIRKWASTL